VRTLQAVWNSVRDAWEIPGTASLLCGHLAVYSGTWPTSGTMRNGAAYALPTWADRMRVSGFSSSPSAGTRPEVVLPTPTVSDTNGAGRHGDGGLDLRTAVALLPTVTVQDGKNNGGPSQFVRNTPPLNTAVLMLPTPRASDGEKGGPNQRGSKGDKTMPSVAAGMGGPVWGEYAPAIRRWEEVMGPAPSPVEPGAKGQPRLSPAFTEWMMGQPAGWVTDPAIGISRNDQIKACGNGVVTQQAVAALADMLGALVPE
jgi:DNA (cytosine-5)-methyltransferase 1